MARPIIQVEEKVGLLEGFPLSLQHLFAMFGASVLVPALFGINPAIVLLMNGVGTLIYLVICKGKAPAFLGSSFAFLSPVFVVLGANKDLWSGNYTHALGGFVASGVIFIIVAIIIGIFGSDWIKIVLPPATMGPIVALIGLELAGVAATMAGIIPDPQGNYNVMAVIVSMVTLAVAVFGSILFRKFFAVIPILIAIIVGYCLSVILGMVNYDAVANASVVALPEFYLPVFDINAIIIIIPAALVVISEHIGHLIVTGNIVGRDLTKNPGLHRSLMGDGISTTISGFVGSVPTTTYGENIGVMAITRVYSIWVIGGAAVISIVLAFIGKLSGVIQSIPIPVMGGISLLLFGVIAASGIRMLVEAKVDYSRASNLVLTSVVFVVGISGAAIKIGHVQLRGMALATVVGMILSIVFYFLNRHKLTNDNGK
jgi:uracil permease